MTLAQKPLIGAPETFFLFSQTTPSQGLGFVDSKAVVLEVEVAGKDYTIHQSPTLLSSNRAGGTTGAGKLGLLAKIYALRPLLLMPGAC